VFPLQQIQPHLSRLQGRGDMSPVHWEPQTKETAQQPNQSINASIVWYIIGIIKPIKYI
jgi:hypothetical protein